MCNIHRQPGRHCPWCGHGPAGQALVMILLCAPQLAVALVSRGNWLVRAVLATAAFPAAGLLVALAYGWHDGYWSQ